MPFPRAFFRFWARERKLNVNLTDSNSSEQARASFASIIFNWNISWQISIYCSLTRVVCSNICQCCHCHCHDSTAAIALRLFMFCAHDTFINYLNLIINWSVWCAYLPYTFISLGETSGRIYGISKTPERYAATYHRIFRASLSG